jgi:K+-transporting ATPase ATPase A chain
MPQPPLLTPPLLISDTSAGLLSVVALLALLALAYVPLGDYLAAVLTPGRHTKPERALYRVLGVDPDGSQSARSYAVAVLAFSGVSILALFAILVGQAHLPFSRGMSGMSLPMALNTAVSFVTNTNWQSYAGEATLGYTAQMAGLAVQNFASAAVGIVVAAVLIRGFLGRQTDEVGNFWVDLVRVNLRLLLPLATIVAVVLIGTGAIQNFLPDHTVTTLAGGTQTLPGGPVASQEAIKELGTNGGGFFNANSAHPYENPNPLSDLMEIFALLLIPVCLTRAAGTMLGNRRQGTALLAAMAVLWGSALALTTWAETAGDGVATRLAGAAMEGKETQFGVWASALFATSTTATSTGAVNSLHDSMTAAGGGVVLLNMLLGEVSPGGTGSGLYGILVAAVVAVFVAGLMVGRTPELLGKKIGSKEMTYVALYVLTTPALVLVGLGVAIALPQTAAAMGNPGGHGFSEVFYAFASAANNNGSAFGGLTVTSAFFELTLAAVMLLGRLAPMMLVIGLAGRLARGRVVPATAGTLPTHTPLFVTLLIGVIVLVGGLTFFPGLALGPIAEALS